MKKLCHVFFDEYPHDSRIRRYTNLLLEEGYKVFIVSLRSDGYKFFQKDNNTFIYRIPLKKKRATFARRIWEYIIFQLYATFLVSYISLIHRVKLFHIHTLPDFLVFSCLIPKLKGDRIILDFHELFPEFMMQHKPNLNYTSLIIKSLILIEKLSFGFATHIITFHDPAREILLKRIKQEKPVVTIMNGVDKTELPVFNKIKSEEFRIVYNGTINFNLNLSLVIKALNIIKIRYPEVYDKIGFYLYGEGPDIGNIKKKASQLNIKNVYFKGRFKFTDMMKELEQASVCILPPKKDIYSDLYYSLKLTEMIYFRIPVIATRLDTYHSYYPEDCLIYFNSDDCEDLAKKILFVYSNSKIETYTDNAFKQYSNYSWDIMKLRYQSLINSI